MKKVLLGTTALIGAAGLFAGAALAEGPKVTVGGFIDFQAGFTDQDIDLTTAGGSQRDYLFQNDTEIHIRVDGKADNGLGYGAVVELEADVSGDADGEGTNADKTYVYLQGGWGRVELGSNTDAAAALKVDASTFARATGGIDGDWYDYVSPISYAPGFILSPDLPIAHGAGTNAGIGGLFGASEDATKITYYSPRFSGFQVGLSFAPDAGNVGTAIANPGAAGGLGGIAGFNPGGFTADNNGDFENVFNAGINYNGKIGQVGVAASLTGEHGKAEDLGFAVPTREDLNAWAAGVNLTWLGWTFGGSYGDWGDSGQFAIPGVSDDADYWTLGVAYDFGPFGASVTYLESDFADNDFHNLSVGVDYKLAPGLVPYAEVNFFDLDTIGAFGPDNEGVVFIVGTELTF